MSRPDLTWAARYDLVLIEGCDGAGKTTLAQAIARIDGAEVRHSPVTPPSIDLLTWYHGILSQPGPLILDRCFLSEAVYGPLYRGRSRLTAADVTQLTRHVIERNGVFVHVTADPVVLHRRLLARAETETLTIAELTRIVLAYENAFEQLEPVAACVRVDTTSIG
jgi:thymidylate kinase